ncbi:MAG: tRNA preQ1(34) S-adenosylmethionine ribosyltransferase-isomerase QueA [Candidatus Goldiibacteriota bacterium]
MERENKYNIENYNYGLDERLIAQKPLAERDRSKLMLLNRKTGAIKHGIFSDIVSFAEPGACFVINNTKVIPARMRGKTRKTGAAIEILLSEKKENNFYVVMMKNSKRVKAGDIINFNEGLNARVAEKYGKTVKIEFNRSGKELEDIFEKTGMVPLPPYIKKDTENKEHKTAYQTIFAEKKGAKAAPTAGFHFTDNLIGKIKKKGCVFAETTLHAGLGTFEPVTQQDIRKHKIHSEEYEIKRKAADIINKAKENGKKVICTGTTSMRVVESVSDQKGYVSPRKGITDIYIYPGYEFRAADALITNFHLPKTTLFALVCAFGGMENIKKAYAEAMEKKYRLFSYGDAMLIY